MDIPGILPGLRKLDLKPLVNQVVLKFNIARVEAEDRVLDLLRFYTLCGLYPNEPLAPSVQIDEIWHLHILDTERYAPDCEKGIGFFLHHRPSDGTTEDFLEIGQAFKTTCQLYKKIFDKKLRGSKSDAANRIPQCRDGRSYPKGSPLAQ